VEYVKVYTTVICDGMECCQCHSVIIMLLGWLCILDSTHQTVRKFDIIGRFKRLQ